MRGAPAALLAAAALAGAGESHFAAPAGGDPGCLVGEAAGNVISAVVNVAGDRFGFESTMGDMPPRRLEDPSEERECRPSEFRCAPSGSTKLSFCVPASWLCDGLLDCPEGDDESGDGGFCRSLWDHMPTPAFAWGLPRLVLQVPGPQDSVAGWLEMIRSLYGPFVEQPGFGDFILHTGDLPIVRAGAGTHISCHFLSRRVDFGAPSPDGSISGDVYGLGLLGRGGSDGSGGANELFRLALSFEPLDPKHFQYPMSEAGQGLLLRNGLLSLRSHALVMLRKYKPGEEWGPWQATPIKDDVGLKELEELDVPKFQEMHPYYSMFDVFDETEDPPKLLQPRVDSLTFIRYVVRRLEVNLDVIPGVVVEHRGVHLVGALSMQEKLKTRNETQEIEGSWGQEPAHVDELEDGPEKDGARVQSVYRPTSYDEEQPWDLGGAVLRGLASVLPEESASYGSSLMAFPAWYRVAKQPSDTEPAPNPSVETQAEYFSSYGVGEAKDDLPGRFFVGRVARIRHVYHVSHDGGPHWKRVWVRDIVHPGLEEMLKVFAEKMGQCEDYLIEVTGDPGQIPEVDADRKASGWKSQWDEWQRKPQQPTPTTAPEVDNHELDSSTTVATTESPSTAEPRPETSQSDKVINKLIAYLQIMNNGNDKIAENALDEIIQDGMSRKQIPPLEDRDFKRVMKQIDLTDGEVSIKQFVHNLYRR